MFYFWIPCNTKHSKLCTYTNSAYPNSAYTNCSYTNCSYTNCSYPNCSYPNCSFTVLLTILYTKMGF